MKLKILPVIFVSFFVAVIVFGTDCCMQVKKPSKSILGTPII